MGYFVYGAIVGIFLWRLAGAAGQGQALLVLVAYKKATAKGTFFHGLDIFLRGNLGFLSAFWPGRWS
ncbi:hypothetical protein QN363_20955, partial [Undibacterium sp. CCC2.1]|uniref:hypothetical protein n=1 Tax=Undibacterium sp. CCC2.1 TaxID=3048604 RepID=UPI002B22B85C